MTTTPVAPTIYGEVEGEWNEGVARFRGVPFADRIDGAGRFRPARPPARWSGVRLAQSWAPMTPQVADPSVVADVEYHRFLFGRFYDQPMSEEGLFLNVWTPSLDNSAKRPVMVWLHGGGFAAGAPTRPREEPSRLCSRGDIVFVAPNHRLGPFGYLYLEDKGAPVITPNLGMLDIVTALEWVRDNIVAFGGDPDNVTVFGESGGAMKVATLIAMPRARGLFHRGICQAGVFAWGSRFGPLSRAAADKASRSLLRRLGKGDDLRSLRAAQMAEIIAAQEAIDGGLMAWSPVLDGEVLPYDPAQAVIEGKDHDVPMIVGCAAHEADFIFHGAPRTLETLTREMGPRGERLFKLYAAERSGSSPEDIIEAILTDWTFRRPAIEFGEARAAHGRMTYVYHFAWSRRDDSSARATHGAENPFVFNRLETTGYSRNAPDAASLSEVMQSAWVAFARAGDPNGPVAPRWPAYVAPERAVMVFDRECCISLDPNRREREAWRNAAA